MSQRPTRNAKPKPLWTCPRCRRQFVNRNQQHSCGDFSEAHLLDGKSPEIVELYERMAALLLRGDDVVIAPTATRVLFKVRSVFASVAIARNWLDLVLVLGRRVKHRRIRKAQEEYPGIVHFLRIDRAEDLDGDLVDWLEEAYAHRREKDLKKEKSASHHREAKQ
jgi:hypothetical protein